MKTLIVSESHGIFCGLLQGIASFTKDQLLCSHMAYAFDDKERAEYLLSKFPKEYRENMEIREIDVKGTYIPLDVLIANGFGDYTGFMLDVMLPEGSTMH